MGLTRRTWVLCSAALLFLALLAWFLWPEHSWSHQAKQLPDGSTVTLQSVTYGKRHRVRTGQRWLDYLGGRLPERWAKKLDCHFATFGGLTNALDFWLVWERFPTALGFRASVFDEHGCESISLPPSSSFLTEQGQQALTFQFTEFPRREKIVGFRLFQQATNGAWSKVTDFSVSNPGTRLYPVWKAEPFPITQSVDGVAYTLSEVRTGLAPFTGYPGSSGASLSFRITKNGRPSSSWEVSSVEGISDALGHTVARRSHTSTTTDTGAYSVKVNSGLCGEESAWRINVEFARWKDFPPADQWTIRAVPVPSTNAASLVDLVTNLHGATFRFCGVVGVGCAEPRVRRSISDSPVAHVVYSNLPGGLQFQFVRAIDNQGRKVTSSGSAGEPPNYIHALEFAPDAKSVDLTYAVSRPVAVQFLAKPTSKQSTKSARPRN